MIFLGAKLSPKLLLLLTPTSIAYIEIVRSLGGQPFVPFLLIFCSAVITSAVLGVRGGLVAALFSCGFIVYSMLISFGPPSLTGGILNVFIGCAVVIITVIILGRMKDENKILINRLKYSQHNLVSNQDKLILTITKLEQSERALKNAKDVAENASRAKSKFLSSMSHELRTPLNAILGFGQLLNMKFSETSNIEAQEQIKDILQAGHHLLGLINEVLDLSSIEAGYLNISTEPINLHQVITESIAQIDVGLAKQRNISLINQVDDKDLAIMADPMRFRQVLMNLLSNAVKYNHEGGTVTVKTELIDKEWLRIAITDTGNGIAAADIDKLFNPFERLAYKNSNVVGTGIGLTVTKQLVEAMDGAIGVESIINQGSTFTVDLPLTISKSRAVDSDKIPLSKTGAAAIKKRKVLYIEDNPANTRLVVSALNHKGGFEVSTSPTAELGLTLAEENIPDIILMDINLPGIDGVAALNILRNIEITRNIPVIAVTAHAMGNDIQAGRDAGFDDYLTKPIELDQLYAVIEKQITDLTAA